MDEGAEEKAPPSIEQRLYANETRPDRVSHLEIAEPEACRECPDKECITICPSRTYRWSEEHGRIQVSFENCLECGSCRIVCPRSNVSWRYPMGGMGICYRYG
jgi:ferredoxin like protein